jgi:hypothetical protein
MEVISLTGRRSRVRPRDEEGGIPVAVDLACLTPEQREVWDENFSDLAEWTEGTICQATLLELWSFGYMCMLDCGVPNWPPELARELADYGRQVGEYMENMRAARGNRAAQERRVAPETIPPGDRRFTFLLDRDGTLLRWDQWLVSDVWWPADEKGPGQWSRYQVDPFTANVTPITPERAQELAGADADLYAEASTDAWEAARAPRAGSPDGTPDPST